MRTGVEVLRNLFKAEWNEALLTESPPLPPIRTFRCIKLHSTFAIMFGKGFHSKLEKVFSFSKNREISDDPPPPYILPDEFIKAEIKEDQLAVLRDYDTVIVLDDSGSMEHLWPQVDYVFPPSWLDLSLILGHLLP